jgi:hypothetical protein
MSSVMSAFSTQQLTQSPGAEVGRLRSHYTCSTVYFALELRIGRLRGTDSDFSLKDLETGCIRSRVPCSRYSLGKGLSMRMRKADASSARNGELPTVRIRWFLRKPKLDAHKVLRNGIFSGGSFPETPFQKRRVSGRHPESSEYRAQPRHNPCWRPPVRSRLPDLRKALRTLSALEHRTELRVCHAQHIHGREITMYPDVEDVTRTAITLINLEDV